MIAKAVHVPSNFAELLQQLGDIPPGRIRLKPPPGQATEKDLDTPNGRMCELIDGVLVEKAVGSLESMLGLTIGGLISVHVRTADLGVVLGADGYIRVGTGLVRAPDVTFIPWASFPDEELPREAYWTVAPGLVVEVLSPGNTKAEIDRKLRELFAAGCKLAWVIDPRKQSAQVHTSAAKFKSFGPDGILDGGRVLPGFKLPLADLFAATKRRKGKPK